MSEIPNDPELNAIASALGGLAPVPSRLDRDRLMFEAGALSCGRAARTGWIWPSVAAMLSLVVTGESIFLASRPVARVVERVVVVREQSVPESSEVTPAASLPPVVILSRRQLVSEAGPLSSWETVSDYQRRQDMVVRFGLEAFPEPVRLSSQSGEPADPSEEVPLSAGALRRMELEKLNKPGGHS